MSNCVGVGEQSCASLQTLFCIYPRNIEFTMRVFVGDYDFDMKESTEQSFHVRAVHKHPDFNSKQPYNNDVAVVELGDSGGPFLCQRSHGRNCVWRIFVPEGNHILLRFHRFSVEWDYSCDLDYLGVYSSSGHLIGKFCGDIRPRPLLIPDRNVTVKFFSDFQEFRSGFSLSYEAVDPNLYPGDSVAFCKLVPDFGVQFALRRWVLCKDSECGSVPVIFEEGEIQSMNHPEPYSSNAICQWVVHCPPSHVIELTFQTFELESHEECIFDYVVVHHDLQGNMVAGKFCGFSIPDPIVSVSNVLQITFISDYAANYIGFRAVISFVLSKSRKKLLF
ncbi:unnamed protein product [Ranitomeya imitator]|uniref:CUB domain-containing protein n=1 Tax=Ranitomeya imitator TaxID=111125 RepID=A0ABN9M3S4_9NEOB|nr:unnamed protein product [Ranitomeya imitator]